MTNRITNHYDCGAWKDEPQQSDCGFPENNKGPEQTNVRLVHEEAIKPDSLYAKRPLDWFVGRKVKMAFQSATSIVEHMWVAVSHVDGDDLVGKLGNEPVFVENIAMGDLVKLRRVQVEAVDLSLDEWVEEVECLGAEGDYINESLGQPVMGSGFEKAFGEGLTPRQALKRWRDSIPSTDD